MKALATILKRDPAPKLKTARTLLAAAEARLPAYNVSAIPPWSKVKTSKHCAGSTAKLRNWAAPLSPFTTDCGARSRAAPPGSRAARAGTA